MAASSLTSVKTRLRKSIRANSGRPGWAIALAHLDKVATPEEAQQVFDQWRGTVAPVVRKPRAAKPAAGRDPEAAPPAPTPASSWVRFTDAPPEQSDYFHTWPCEFPDGRGCWYNHSTKEWMPYDAETPAPKVVFYRPIIQGPAL
jgi:ribosomal protein L39E